MSKNPTSILIVEDERDIFDTYCRVLRHSGFSQIYGCATAAEARAMSQKKGADLILLDLNLRKDSGLDLLTYFQEVLPETPVVVITGNCDTSVAVACIKAGAYDYLTKPVDPERFLATAQNALAWHQVISENRKLSQVLFSGEPKNAQAFSAIVTQAPALQKLFAYAEMVADSPRPILITGENGTGKELLARAIHDAGGRAREPWVAVNVAGLDDHAFSDTLFGHTKGAFTGAAAGRAGLVEQAQGGDLLLDEIGDLRIESQIKLLRLLQESEYRPLGADSPRACRARILATTNCDLTQAVKSGIFRADLYYRLKFHHLHLPPLRERASDIPLLSNWLLEKAAKELGCERTTIEPSALAWLCHQPFPRNIRELEGLLFDATARFAGKSIPLSHFVDDSGDTAEKILESYARVSDFSASFVCEAVGYGAVDFGACPVLPTLGAARASLIREALRRSGGNQAAAARMLCITPQALSKSLLSSKRKKAVGGESHPDEL